MGIEIRQQELFPKGNPSCLTPFNVGDQVWFVEEGKLDLVSVSLSEWGISEPYTIIRVRRAPDTTFYTVRHENDVKTCAEHELCTKEEAERQADNLNWERGPESLQEELQRLVDTRSQRFPGQQRKER